MKKLLKRLDRMNKKLSKEVSILELENMIHCLDQKSEESHRL